MEARAPEESKQLAVDEIKLEERTGQRRLSAAKHQLQQKRPPSPGAATNESVADKSKTVDGSKPDEGSPKKELFVKKEEPAAKEG